MSSNFEMMAKQRYPFTGDSSARGQALSTAFSGSDNEHNLRMAQLRTDYIAALRECKSRPAFTLITPWGEFFCTSEPLMPDDTRGWQTVRSHGRTSGKKRSSRTAVRRDMDDYEDY